MNLSLQSGENGDAFYKSRKEIREPMKINIICDDSFCPLMSLRHYDTGTFAHLVKMLRNFSSL